MPDKKEGSGDFVKGLGERGGNGCYRGREGKSSEEAEGSGTMNKERRRKSERKGRVEVRKQGADNMGSFFVMEMQLGSMTVAHMGQRRLAHLPSI